MPPALQPPGRRAWRLGRGTGQPTGQAARLVASLHASPSQARHGIKPESGRLGALLGQERAAESDGDKPLSQRPRCALRFLQEAMDCLYGAFLAGELRGLQSRSLRASMHWPGRTGRGHSLTVSGFAENTPSFPLTHTDAPGQNGHKGMSARLRGVMVTCRLILLTRCGLRWVRLLHLGPRA